MDVCHAAIALVVGLAAALTIATAPAAAQTVPLSPRVLLKVGAIGAVSDAGIFVAQDKGYFKDEGLDVELVSFKAAPQILPAIATGEVQASGSAVTPALFNAFARGITMKLVADKGQVAKGFGFAAIVIRSDLADTIKDFKDLKGRKFAVMGKGVSSTTQLGKALELGGIEPNEVELIELGLPEMVAALGNKAIDGATLLEPFITLASARNVAVRWKGMEDFLPFTGQNGVIIYSQAFAREQPEAAKRWMVAYLKGVRAYLDAVTSGTDRDGVNAILAKHTAVKDLSLLARIAATGFDPNGRMESGASRPTRTGSSSSGCSRLVPTSARSSTINTPTMRSRGWVSAERAPNLTPAERSGARAVPRRQGIGQQAEGGRREGLHVPHAIAAAGLERDRPLVHAGNRDAAVAGGIAVAIAGRARGAAFSHRPARPETLPRGLRQQQRVSLRRCPHPAGRDIRQIEQRGSRHRGIDDGATQEVCRRARQGQQRRRDQTAG